MAQSKVMKNQITEGVIWKQLLVFCFPIILGTLFQQMYNAADVIVIGHFVGKYSGKLSYYKIFGDACPVSGTASDTSHGGIGSALPVSVPD